MFARKPIPVHDLKTTSTGEVRRRNVLWRWRRLFFLVGLLMATATAGVAFVLSQIELPNDGVVAPEEQTSYLCDASVAPGTPCNASNALAAFHGDENRQNVKYADVPKVLIDAVVSAEDRDYFDHEGVNPTGIARAAWADIRGGKQGGSTITQQYVKNVFLTNERTLTRKLKESVMAVKLEQKVEKEEILERYLNVIYFGRGAYGVQAASRAYFNKDMKDILLHEAALLAGLIRSPTTAEPFDSPEENAEARRRRKTVLVAMEQEGYIKQADVEQADAVPLDEANHLLPPKPSTGVDYLKGREWGAEYFVEHVRQQLRDRYGEATLYGGGLQIYTTIDLNQQKAAWEAVTTTLNEPGDPAGSLVAIDEFGQIKAMMGGRKFGNNPEAGESTVNLATGKAGGGGGREPGSTFKAFALAEAVKQGYSIESKFESPTELKIPTPNSDEDFWTVRGGCCEGVADLVQATKHSTNTVYAQLMMELGPDKVVKTANELGITAELPPVPSIVLGTGSVSVLDMASAYSTFQNNGVHVEPTSLLHVQLPDGTARNPPEPVRRQVLSPDQCAKVVHALQAVLEKGGTGDDAAFGRPAAGKTGTTQNNRDAWFVGFTPKLTAAVWMGYPGTQTEAPKPMEQVHGQSVSGGNLPAQVWKKFMSAVANVDVGNFPKPRDDIGAGRQMHPELHTTTTPSTTPPTRPEEPRPPSTERPDRPPPSTWPKPTWPKPTWPTTSRPGNGNTTSSTTPATNPDDGDRNEG